jgi:hypothetical protein
MSAMKTFSHFLLATILLVTSFAVNATDLRGQVVGQIRIGNNISKVPRSGVSVSLAKRNPNGLSVIRHTITNNSGLYFFSGVTPGVYIIMVNSRQYPISVINAPYQDLPLIYM